MLARLLLSVTLFALGFGIYIYRVRWQIKRLATTASSDPIMQQIRPGIPAIVYFTTPHCVPCRTRQQPALANVLQSVGDDGLQIVKIDASQDPESADRWGVFSAPTTFVLDKQGKIRAVNHGVADAGKLERQLHYTA
jgi:thiol-disulfide isomerase/thioredoxin